MFKWIKDQYSKTTVQARAAMWFFVCSFLQKGISTITVPIFTRLMTTSEYGQYSVFNSWLSILTVFVSMSMYSGMYTQGLIKYESERAVYSSSLQGLVLTLTAAWTAVYLLFRPFFNQLLRLTTVQMLAMLVMIWSTSAFNFWAVEKRVEYKYRDLVIVTLIASAAKPMLGIYFVMHAEDKVTARILGLALVELVAYTGLFVAQMRRGKTFYSKRFWHYALSLNIPLIPHYLSSTVLDSADRIMISAMCGKSSAGIYSVAYSVSQIMTLFNTALIQTINPWMYQKIHHKQVGDISTVAYPAMILIASVNFLMIALAPELMAIFAPKEYYDAIWVIPPAAMSVFFVFAYNLFACFEFYYENTRLIALATMMAAVLNIVLNYIFIKLFGYYAAGYTTLFCYAAYAGFHYYFMRKICKDNMAGQTAYDLKVLISISIIFIVSGILLLLTYRTAWLRYGILLIFLMVLLYKKNAIYRTFQRFIQVRK